MQESLEPLAKEHRHRADYRDEIEHAEVARVLSLLPAEHPARIAYLSGTREASDSIILTHLMPERMDLVAMLVEAYFAHQRRIWACASSFRPA